MRTKGQKYRLLGVALLVLWPALAFSRPDSASSSSCFDVELVGPVFSTKNPVPAREDSDVSLRDDSAHFHFEKASPQDLTKDAPSKGKAPSAPLPPLKYTPEVTAARATAELDALGYKDIEIIENGGMGVVVSAKDPTGKTRAIKFLMQTERRYVKALNGEVDVMNHLASKDPRFPAAKRVTFASKTGPLLEAMEMDFLPGETLHSLLHSNHFSEHPEHKQKISSQIHNLIRVAHENGVWHQDLKPRNVMVQFNAAGEPVVTLLDWGLAEHQPAHGGQGAILPPREGTLQGTHGYISEEKYMGAPSSEADDVHAMRMLDWQIRLGGESDRDLLVIRNTQPAPIPFEPDARTVGDIDVVKEEMLPRLSDPRDSSDFIGSWKEPATALDQTGPLSERIVAMAEWSAIPRNSQQREQLLKEARTETPDAFLEAHGKRLMNPFLRPVRTVETAHVIEILGSSVLIENLHPEKGLKIPKDALETIARTAVQIYKQTRIFNDHPTSVGQVGPHHLLRYRLMKAQIDKLHADGLLEHDWRGYDALSPATRR